MAITIQLRRDTREHWYLTDAILAPGEPGFETDTGKIKIGNGVARWGDLEYIDQNDDDIIALVESHIKDLQAQNVDEAALHAAVVAHIQQLQSAVLDDDGPSLFLLYENAKV